MEYPNGEKKVIDSPQSFDKFLSVALIFPNEYHLGMSNLGFQTIYRELNGRKDCSCERVFYPEIRTIETKRTINNFDCICISLPYELDFSNALYMLNKINIPLLSSDRANKAPLIILGGAFCSINPEIIAPFADIIMIGEAEEVIHELFDNIHDKKTHSISKDDFLREISYMHGIYIPSLIEVNYYEEGKIKSFGSEKKIERNIVKPLNGLQTYSPIVSVNAHFSDTFLVEVNRGCPYACKFCAVRKISSPFREYGFGEVWDAIRLGSRVTHKIGLVGSAIGSLSYFEELLERLAVGGFEVGLSSLRTDKITHKIAKLLSQCNIKTLTIAPEAGSEKLRKSIRKGLSDEQIFTAAEVIANSKIKNVKLYFIVGLPNETDEDILSIIEISKKIREITGANITLSINPFIPKPHTDFQSYQMENPKTLKKKYQVIKNGLKSEKHIKIHFESIRLSTIQALLSKGDRRLAELLILKATTDLNWNDCIKESGTDLNFYIYRHRDEGEILPWSILKTRY